MKSGQWHALVSEGMAFDPEVTDTPPTPKEKPADDDLDDDIPW